MQRGVQPVLALERLCLCVLPRRSAELEREYTAVHERLPRHGPGLGPPHLRTLRHGPPGQTHALLGPPGGKMRGKLPPRTLQGTNLRPANLCVVLRDELQHPALGRSQVHQLRGRRFQNTRLGRGRAKMRLVPIAQQRRAVLGRVCLHPTVSRDARLRQRVSNVQVAGRGDGDPLLEPDEERVCFRVSERSRF